MHFTKWKSFVFGLAILAMTVGLAAAPVVQAAPFRGDETPPGEDDTLPGDFVTPFTTFLPLVSKPPIYLNGTVTFRGVPAAYQQIQLRVKSGDMWDTYTYTSTDAAGFYQLEVPASWAGIQSAYLLWNNTIDNDAWLSAWYCNSMEQQPQSDVSCSFDIQDVALKLSSYKVSLPYSFQWSKRVLGSDSYEFNLFDPANSDNWFYSGPLGYVNSYLLAGLPNTFATSVEYGWAISVYGPDGQGDSYYYISVAFNNRGTSVALPQVKVPRLMHEDRLRP